MSEQDQLPFLPSGWIEVKLREVLPIEYGKGLPQKARDSGGKVPVYGSNGLVGWHSEALTTSATLIIGRKGGAGQVHYSSVPCWAIDTAYYVEAAISKFINLRYFSHLLKTVGLEQLDKSTAIPSLSRDDYNQVKVPLAPRTEQQRIVEEIEKQFSRLDAAVEILQRVERNLERLRTATLKAAVEGRLVPTEAELARGEGRDYEPADVLLQRILRERRAKWEADQLAKMKEQGKTPKNDRWKARYIEPPFPDINNLPTLPEGWVWVTLGQLTWSVKDGPHYSPEYVDEGIPFITGGNVRPSGVDFDNAKRISPELHKELSKRVKPELGDILYTKGGTTGIARVNTYEREFNVWVHVAVLKLAGHIDPFYVQHSLNSPQGYAQAQRFTHGVGNQDLGLTRMIKIVFGLAPLAEQLRIVAEIERRISVIEELKTLVTNALRRAAIMRQKILGDAFAGKLVPQDPADEPASLLLERIRAEKVGREAKAQQSRKERREKMKGSTPKTTKRKPRRTLRETIAESKRRLTPEELFTEAGFTHEVVEDFYEELRREIKAGHIKQVRPNNAKVYLVVASA